jgi:hypothetical protein
MRSCLDPCLPARSAGCIAPLSSALQLAMRMHARMLTCTGTSSVSLSRVFSQLGFYLLEAIDFVDEERRERGSGDMGHGGAQDARAGGVERMGTQRARPLRVAAVRAMPVAHVMFCWPVRCLNPTSGVPWLRRRRQQCWGELGCAGDGRGRQWGAVRGARARYRRSVYECVPAN